VPKKPKSKKTPSHSEKLERVNRQLEDTWENIVYRHGKIRKDSNPSFDTLANPGFRLKFDESEAISWLRNNRDIPYYTKSEILAKALNDIHFIRIATTRRRKFTFPYGLGTFERAIRKFVSEYEPEFYQNSVASYVSLLSYYELAHQTNPGSDKMPTRREPPARLVDLARKEYHRLDLSAFVRSLGDPNPDFPRFYIAAGTKLLSKDSTSLAEKSDAVATGLCNSKAQAEFFKKWAYLWHALYRTRIVQCSNSGALWETFAYYFIETQSEPFSVSSPGRLAKMLEWRPKKERAPSEHNPNTRIWEAEAEHARKFGDHPRIRRSPQFSLLQLVRHYGSL